MADGWQRLGLASRLIRLAEHLVGGARRPVRWCARAAHLWCQALASCPAASAGLLPTVARTREATCATHVQAWEAAMDRVVLTVLSANQAAQALYKRQGFRLDKVGSGAGTRGRRPSLLPLR